MAEDIALSICVPTFNRVEMLRRNITFHRAAFRALRIAFEIVVVDDCSTDGTAAYLATLADKPEVRAHRRLKNSGFVDNYAFAMRRARGRYAVFLGDDDLLIPQQVAACLARLEADPALGMIQAPWLCIDERPGAGPIGPFYHLPGEQRFARGDHAGLTRLVLQHHVFPEFMIIRRDVLARSISSPCPFIFWAFLYTARALAQADALFVPEPFARVTAVSADPRQQQGNGETMFQWDRYRGGLEYLVSLSAAGSPHRVASAEDVTRFMLIRQKVALRLNLAAGNWPEAYILHHRIAAYEAPPLGPAEFHQLCQLAGITTAAAEAAAFSAAPVVVDPLITDEMLGVLKPELRGRMVREGVGEDEAGGRIFLRLNPAFPDIAQYDDEIFDIRTYIAQLVPI